MLAPKSHRYVAVSDEELNLCVGHMLEGRRRADAHLDAVVEVGFIVASCQL